MAAVGHARRAALDPRLPDTPHPIVQPHPARGSFLYAPEVTREKLERAGFRVVAWHDPTAESLAQALARAKALETGTLPPLGIHVLIGPNFPTVSNNMVRNLEERRIQLVNAVLQRAA